LGGVRKRKLNTGLSLILGELAGECRGMPGLKWSSAILKSLELQGMVFIELIE
jgi:hypothetical protein